MWETGPRATRRRTTDPRPAPRREGPPGRLRRLRCLGPGRRGRQAHLLRPLRPAAPRAGVGRHRDQRRLADARLQGHGAGLPGLRRALARSLHGHLAVGHCRYSTTGGSHLGERPAHPRRPRPAARSRWPTTATSSTPPSCATVVDGPQRRGHAGHLGGELRRGNTTDTALVTALLADDPDRTPRGGGAGRPAPAAGRLLLRLHGRAHAVRRPRPAGHPPAGPRPPRARLGRRLRDRGPRHRRRQPRPRGRAGRARRHRRGRPAHRSGSPRPTPRAVSSSTSTWPAPTPTSPAGTCTRPASRWAASWPASTRSRPTWSYRRPSRAPRPRSATPRSPASPTARGWSRTPTSAARSSSRRQTIRQLGIRLKLNPLKDVIRGKRLVVVDDSIVRGNTQRALVRMLREAGAAEVHVRISSPPVKWPCFYGIDFATRAELIATGIGVEEVGTSHRRRHPRLHLRGRHDRGDRPAARPALHGLLRRRLPDGAAGARPLGKACSSCRWRSTLRRPATRRRRCARAGTAPAATSTA